MAEVSFEAKNKESDKAIIRGDIIISPSGDCFLIVQTELADLRVISLESGNRFTSSVYTKNTTLGKVALDLGYGSLEKFKHLRTSNYCLTIKEI